MKVSTVGRLEKYMPKQQKIKFIIQQDGTVIEEVQGAEGNQCLDVTLPFEKALNNVNVISREYKPEYYNVTLQQNQNEDHKQTSINTSIDV